MNLDTLNDDAARALLDDAVARIKQARTQRAGLPDLSHALIEQLGHKVLLGKVVTHRWGLLFTPLDAAGPSRLLGAPSLHTVTWLTEPQARYLATQPRHRRDDRPATFGVVCSPFVGQVVIHEAAPGAGVDPARPWVRRTVTRIEGESVFLVDDAGQVSNRPLSAWGEGYIVLEASWPAPRAGMVIHPGTVAEDYGLSAVQHEVIGPGINGALLVRPTEPAGEAVRVSQYVWHEVLSVADVVHIPDVPAIPLSSGW